MEEFKKKFRMLVVRYLIEIKDNVNNLNNAKNKNGHGMVYLKYFKKGDDEEYEGSSFPQIKISEYGEYKSMKIIETHIETHIDVEFDDITFMIFQKTGYEKTYDNFKNNLQKLLNESGMDSTTTSGGRKRPRKSKRSRKSRKSRKSRRKSRKYK